MDSARDFCVAAMLILVVAPCALGGHVELRPTVDRDAFSVSGGPYAFRPDGLGALIVGSGFESQQHQWRTVMEFPLAGVEQDVHSATLSFTLEVVQNPPAAYVVHGYIADGSIAAEDLLVNNPIGPVRIVPSETSVDVTSFLQTAVESGASYAGFLLTGFPGGSGLSIRASEPYAGSSLLSVDSTVPEPASALGVSMFAIGLLARRRAPRRDVSA